MRPMIRERGDRVKERLQRLTRVYECGTKIVMPVGGIAIIEDALGLIDYLEKENDRLRAKRRLKV